jgi:hypothetical protein
MRSRTPNIPKVSYGDSYSIGQLCAMWEKPTIFVRGLIACDLLAVDERGLATNTELRRFYRESGEVLDA